jgi:hypothetical protein
MRQVLALHDGLQVHERPEPRLGAGVMRVLRALYARGNDEVLDVSIQQVCAHVGRSPISRLMLLMMMLMLLLLLLRGGQGVVAVERCGGLVRARCGRLEGILREGLAGSRPTKVK